MDIVKMSLLSALLPEEEDEERREEEKKREMRREKKRKTLTLLPSTVFLCAFAFGFFFFFSFFSMLHTWKQRERKQKHHHHRERERARASYDDAFRQRAHYSVFLCVLCAQAYVNTHFFLIYIFFVPIAYMARSKTKERATSLYPLRARSLSLCFILTYMRNKSHREFFLTRTISLTANAHGVKKKREEKKKKKKSV